MAKSAGSFITLQTVIDKGYEPIAYRFLCLGTHYRKQLMFSWEAMNTAANAYEALKNKIAELNEQGKEDESKAYHEKFMQEINDDMNRQSLA